MVRKSFRPLNIFISCLYLLTFGCSSSLNIDHSEPRWLQKYLIGTYYYLRYPENWQEGCINGQLLPQQLPALGQYKSADLTTIEQHIAWSSQYGIDFWAISWWPDRPEIDRIIGKKILKAKNINDIKFCIFYETVGPGLVNEKINFTPKKKKRLISDFKDLAKNYFAHPSYLKIKGRPVIILYLSRTFTGEYPETLLMAARTDEQGFYNLSRLNLPPGSYEVRANLTGHQEICSKIGVEESYSRSWIEEKMTAS